MSYFIAADGGGTKTELVLFDETGRALQSRNTGASNPIFMDSGQAFDNIVFPIDDMLRQQGVGPEELSGIILLIPGIRLLLPELSKKYPESEITAGGDELSALYAGLGGKPGIALLSGTGSFAAGRGEDGAHASVGGWGSLFGDEGSGYRIGADCLRTVTQRYDSGFPAGLLTEKVMAHFGIHVLTELRSLQSRQELFTRERIAALCLLVSECAAQGDPDALTVIDHAADGLCLLVKQCSARLKFLPECRYPCVLLGGVSGMGNLIKDPLRRKLAQSCPGFYLQDSRLRPVAGAVLYQLTRLGEITPQMMKHIESIG